MSGPIDGNHRTYLIATYIQSTGNIPCGLAEELRRLGNAVHIFAFDYDLPLLGAYFRDIHRGHNSSWILRHIAGRALLDKVRRLTPDVLLIYGTNWYLDNRLLAKLKRDFGVRIVIWEGNNRWFEPFRAAALRYYDMVLTNDAGVIPYIQIALDSRPVHYLQGTNMTDWDQPLHPTKEERDQYEANVSFFGSAHPHRREFFRKLGRRDVKLWGRGWASDPKLAHIASSLPVGDLRRLKVTTASKICLDIHAAEQVDALSSRVFVIPLCGSFLLTEYRPSLEKHFVIGEEIDVFRTVEECNDKIDYYLAQPRLRLQMVERAKRRILQHWTMAHSAIRIMKWVQGYFR
jgi:spore maturation protein CgeB